MPICCGRLVRAHLIDRQFLRREKLDEMHPDVWVLACGGIGYGNTGHHGLLDAALGVRRNLVIDRALIPEATERFAEEYGITWWLDRRYGIA